MRHVLPRTWTVRHGEARVGGVPLPDLARRHGTPLLVIDVEHLRGRLRRFRAAFGPDAGLVYAAKAFLCGALVRILAEEGWWIDAVSGGELELARRAGLEPGRIVLHGNAKSADELAAAVRVGVGRIVVDHPAEIPALAREVTAAGAPPVRILLRLNIDLEPETHDKVKTTGRTAHFGMDVRTAARVAARASRMPELALAGVHIHAGSQIRDLGLFRSVAASAVDFVEDTRERFGDPVELDLGGGLAVPYVTADRTPDPEDYAGAIFAGLEEARALERVGATRLFVEPGRSVMANAGVTLYRVQARKTLPGTGEVLAVDGGLSDNPRPSLYGARYEVLAATRPDEEANRTFRVVGRHCESGDVIAPSARLPAGTVAGDLLVLAASGAYGYAMSSRYNGVGRPAVVFVGWGEAHEVVRRETFHDLFACDAVAADGPSGLDVARAVPAADGR